MATTTVGLPARLASSWYGGLLTPYRWARPIVRRLTRPLARVLEPATPFAYLVAALSVVTYVTGWRLGWHEFLVMSATGLICLVVAAGFTVGRAILSVDVQLEPARVVVGERVGGRLGVTNAASRRLLPLRMELPVGIGLAAFDVPSLAAGVEHEDLFVVPTSRRGVIPVGPAKSVRADPLGLLRREVTWTDVLELYVHPRTVLLDGVGAGFLRDLEGEATKELSNADVAFHALRDYVAGDDRRHVHWKTTARTRKLMVRQFVDTRRSHVAVVLSADPEEFATDDEFELAISTAGSLGLQALRDDQTLTFIAGAHTIPPVGRRTVLDGLARTEFTTGAGVGDVANRTARLAPDASVVILVTGSTVEPGAIRQAAGWFSPDVRVITVQADVAGRSGFRPSGNVLLCTLSALDELQRLLTAVSRS